MGQYRMERLNVLLRDEISNLILRGEIRDPRVTGRKGGAAARTELAPFLSINRVEVSQDLSYAKIYVSSFASDAMLEKGVDVYHEIIDAVMTRNPRWIDSREMAINALQYMSDHRITGMPVLDENGIVVGSVLMQDIFKAGIVR